MADSSSRLENQILHFSRQGKWDKVEKCWEQFVEAPSDSAKFYATLAKRMVRAEKHDELQAWVLMLVESCKTLDLHKTLIQACRGVLSVRPEFEELREPLVETLDKQYRPRHENFELYLEQSGLRHEAGLYKPLTRFLQYTQYSEGEVFKHGDWGEGKVVELDLQDEKVRIQFTNAGEKIFSFAGVREFLKRLPRQHFLAQRVLNPEGLAKTAQENPVDFLKYCLKGLGGRLHRSDLKEALAHSVFTERKWNSWWTKHRDAFRFDPYIGFEGAGGNIMLSLREAPKSLYEEIFSDFQKADTFARRYAILADALKLHGREPIDKALATQMRETLLEALEALPESDKVGRLEYLYLIEDLSAAVEGLERPTGLPDPGALLLASAQPREVIASIGPLDYQIRAAEAVKQADPEHWEAQAEALFLKGPNRLGQWLLRNLIDEGRTEAASHMTDQLLLSPQDNPELFIWVLKNVRDGKLPELHVEASPELLLPAILDQMDRLQREIDFIDEGSTAGPRGLVSRLQNLLADKQHALVTEAFASYDMDRARAQYRALVENPSLSDSFKASTGHALRREFDFLEKAEAEQDEADQMLVTAASFEERQREYLHIKNEEIPQNSQDIGTAAAQGDLSENAEYDAAKERQKILFRRLEALEDQLQRARVVEPDAVRTDVIGFGTAFEVQNLETGQTEAYQLLGHWDAAPEKRILSYQTPFGQQFMNSRVGEELEITAADGSRMHYRVQSIRNALTTGEPADA